MRGVTDDVQWVSLRLCLYVLSTPERLRGSRYPRTQRHFSLLDFSILARTGARTLRRTQFRAWLRPNVGLVPSPMSLSPIRHVLTQENRSRGRIIRQTCRKNQDPGRAKSSHGQLLALRVLLSHLTSLFKSHLIARSRRQPTAPQSPSLRKKLAFEKTSSVRLWER